MGFSIICKDMGWGKWTPKAIYTKKTEGAQDGALRNSAL